jgi:hypothetical protein
MKEVESNDFYYSRIFHTVEFESGTEDFLPPEVSTKICSHIEAAVAELTSTLANGLMTRTVNESRHVACEILTGFRAGKFSYWQISTDPISTSSIQ